MVVRRWCGVAWIAVLSGCRADPTAGSGGSLGDSTDAGDEVTEGPPGTTQDTGDSSISVTSSEESSVDSDVDLCPETHACVAPAPLGWSGPVALVDNEDAACPDLYPTLEVDAFAQVVGAPARCTCECDASSLCGGLIGSDIESACEFPTPIIGFTEFQVPDVCEPIPALDGGGFHLAFEPDPFAQCSPSATSIRPEPTTSDRVLACGEPALVGGCQGDLVCAPRLIESDAIAPCIMRTGAHECPPDFPVARTAWTDLLDERECSTCECAATDGPPTCNATVRISSTDDCSSPEVPDFQVGAFACVPNDGASLSYLSFSDVTAFVSGCAPSGGTAIGTVEPADPVTICCGG